MGSDAYFRVRKDPTYSCGECVEKRGRALLSPLLPPHQPLAVPWGEGMRYRWLDRDVGGRYPHGDFIHSRHACMLRRAFDVVHPLLLPHGEFLPMRIGEDEGFLYNVLNCVDAVDAERSGWALTPQGVPFGIHTYAMHRSKVSGHAFWVPGNAVDLFVSGEVQDLVIAHGLTGWLFESIELTTPLSPPGPRSVAPWAPPPRVRQGRRR